MNAREEGREATGKVGGRGQGPGAAQVASSCRITDCIKIVSARALTLYFAIPYFTARSLTAANHTRNSISIDLR